MHPLRCLFIVALVASSAAFAGDDELERVLQQLGSGSVEERYQALESLSSALRSVTRADPSDTTRLERTTRRLLSLARTQPDDWIAVQIWEKSLALLGYGGDFDAMARDALRSPSPNLRLGGVRWFKIESDPAAIRDLESLWRSETRSWIRVDLLLALAHQGVRLSSDELGKLVSGEDPSLARAAVSALEGSTDPAVLPTLVRAAGRGGLPLRLAALEALAGFVDSPEALDAALDLSGDPDPRIRASAISLLGDFAQSRAADRLERIIRSDEPPDLRSLALGTLASRDDPRVVELAHQLDRDTTEAVSVRDAAAAVLTARGLAPIPRDELEGEFISFSCGGTMRLSLRGEVSYGRVRPSEGRSSVRCWPAPGIEDASEIDDRLRQDLGVEIHDSFERDHELWLHVSSDVGDYCWVPDSAIEKLEAPDPDEADEDEEVDLDEFDLPGEELDTKAAAILLDEQLLDVIEDGVTIVGVALRSPTTEAGRAALARADEEAPPGLRAGIEALLERLADANEPSEPAAD